MKVAVLFLIFNRPDPTARVFSAIRAARPTRLYVAADGPRSDRAGEARLCDEARRVATLVDWPCRVQTLFRDANLGPRLAVQAAIDWFFAAEEDGVILEDDCVPAAAFFRFCEELLERFRLNPRVMAICGSSFDDGGEYYRASYYFSYYADMWGWATWRRAWRLYDRDLSRWPSFRARGGLKALAKGGAWREAYWAGMFDATRAGRIVCWDYQWIYSVIENQGVACHPVRNLVSNIGFRLDATHTIASEADLPPMANRPHQALGFPLIHAAGVSPLPAVERRIEAVRLGLTPPTLRQRLGRLKRALRSPARRLFAGR